MLGLTLLIILIVLLLGTMPSWPYSRNWGYRPSGILGLLLIILIILLLAGYIPFISAEKPILIAPKNGTESNSRVADTSTAIIVPEKTSPTIVTPDTNTNEKK